MRRLAAAALLATMSACRGSDVPSLIWDIEERGQLDTTNKRIDLHNSEAIVDLRRPDSFCPSGLGDVIEGPGEVQKINLSYDVPRQGRYWLHVVWNPGESGDEQFEVVSNGSPALSTPVVKGTNGSPDRTESFEIMQKAGANQIELRRISGDGLAFRRLLLTSTKDLPTPVTTHKSAPVNRIKPMPSVEPQVLNPSLPFKDATSYAQEIGEAGFVLENEHLLFFAPRTREKEARTIFPYLVRAYDSLHRIVGVDTEYKIVVYHFPPGNQHARGTTGQCALWYGYANLELENQPEWTQHHVPHLCGYIEEMAHNFVDATKANFGWEMLGWSIGTKVSLEVGDNPVLRAELAKTRQAQAETFERYKAAGFVFPADIAPNLVDRIHAHILWQCEREYGNAFWPDFFTEVRKEHERLFGAIREQGDEVRNARYRITVECFDRLPGLEFSERLESNRISRTVAVQSVRPTEPDWNRRLE